jgi:hypothetical protein
VNVLKPAINFSLSEHLEIDQAAALRDLDEDVDTYRAVCAGFGRQIDKAVSIIDQSDAIDLQPVLKSIHELITSAHIVGAKRASSYLRHCESMFTSGELGYGAGVRMLLHDVREVLTRLGAALPR